MHYGKPYWNIKQYLPYQKNFNLIDSERSIGKTYTTQGFMIERALERGEEFAYIVRTDKEVKEGTFEKAFSKVITKEFPDEPIKFTSDRCFLKDEETGDETNLGWCLAISTANKKKRINLPNLRWMLFDEYIIDGSMTAGGGRMEYVNGWNEPNLFLKLYHTLDREEDRITVFMLANSISFFNPYHLHKAFNIPKQPKGKIWYNKNVLYHWTEGSVELKEKKKKCKFLEMIEDTDYGEYAIAGNFVNDNESMVMERTKDAKIKYIIYSDKMPYGVWYDRNRGDIFIDKKYDKSCPLRYSFDKEPVDDNAIIIKGTQLPMIKWLSNKFKNRCVYFVNMEVKNRLLENIYKII